MTRNFLIVHQFVLTHCSRSTSILPCINICDEREATKVNVVKVRAHLILISGSIATTSIYRELFITCTLGNAIDFHHVNHFINSYAITSICNVVNIFGFSCTYCSIAEFVLLDMNRNINWDLLGIEVNCQIFEDISIFLNYGSAAGLRTISSDISFVISTGTHSQASILLTSLKRNSCIHL